jgi:hypothetical protein
VRDIHERELRVYTDPGRCMRPLLIVDAHEQKLKIKRSHIQEMHVAEKEGQQYDFNWSDIVSRVLRTRPVVLRRGSVAVAACRLRLTARGRRGSSSTLTPRRRRRA